MLQLCQMQSFVGDVFMNDITMCSFAGLHARALIGTLWFACAQCWFCVIYHFEGACVLALFGSVMGTE